MKATLEFDLNEIDDRLEHKRAITATNAYLVLFDMDNYFRNKMKYEDLTQEVDDALEHARNKLHDFMNEHGVNLGDLE